MFWDHHGTLRGSRIPEDFGIDDSEAKMMKFVREFSDSLTFAGLGSEDVSDVSS